MSSRNHHTRSTVGPTLSGLGLAAAIAREAADAVPVVKQALGVVVRILLLAEKIDKDREALHALAEQSVQLIQRMSDILGDEEPHPKMLPSVERMYMAVRDVEAFMSKHVARNWFIRGVSYAFSMGHHVARLSCNLDNAFQEIVTVALLRIEQGAQYDGEFRLIRHCQVDKLELIRVDKDEGEGSGLVVRYHRARVDGQLVVVRYWEANCPEETHATHASKRTLRHRVASCDNILMEMSTVQRSHPNVARIYGWSKGPLHNRFTVFRSGFRDMDSVLHESPYPIATLGSWAFKLLDAVHHLKTMEISWASPCTAPFALDERLEPTIGLQNDLRRMDPDTEQVTSVEVQIYWTLDEARKSLQMTDMALASCRQERLRKLLGRFGTTGGHRHVIHKAYFSRGRALNDAVSAGLHRLLDEGAADTSWHVDSWMWTNILLAMAKSRGHRLNTGLKVLSTSETAESDSVEVFAIDEDSDSFLYERHRLNIRHDDWDDVREILGIVPSAGDTGQEPYLVPVGESSMVSAPE